MVEAEPSCGVRRAGCVGYAANELSGITKDVGWGLFQSLDPGDVRALPQPSFGRTQLLSCAAFPAEHSTWNGCCWNWWAQWALWERGKIPLSLWQHVMPGAGSGAVASEEGPG